MTKKLSLILLSVLVSLSLLAGTAMGVPGKAKSDSGKSADQEKSSVQSGEKAFKANSNAKALEKAKGAPMQFNDTATHWSNGYVKKAQSLGLVNGYEDGSFQPDAPVTEVETMVMAVRLAELLETEAVTDADTDSNTETDEDAILEDDVEAEDDTEEAFFEEEELEGVPGWVKNAAKKAAKLKIANLNFLHSDVQATRLSAAVQIAIAAELTPAEVDTTLYKGSELLFKDSGTIPADALGYIVALRNNNYIQGDTEDNFNPDSPITRAEIAAILARIAESLDVETPDEVNTGDDENSGEVTDETNPDDENTGEEPTDEVNLN